MLTEHDGIERVKPLQADAPPLPLLSVPPPLHQVLRHLAPLPPLPVLLLPPDQQVQARQAGGLPQGGLQVGQGMVAIRTVL